MTDTWTEAYNRNIRLVESHPRFNDVIKAVAAADWCVPMRVLDRMRRNSRTYGSWVTRGANGVHGNITGISNMTKARARRLVKIVADELFPAEDRVMPDGEYEAKVWGATRDYIRARVLHHPDREKVT